MELTTDHIFFALAVILLVFWSSLWFHHTLSLAYGKWRLHFTPTVSVEDLQGVSIIKPLTGVDPNLYNNLETFFGLKYPAYELLFCVEDETDLALPIVRSLINKYPNIDAKLHMGKRNVGTNGKINNMIQGYDNAKYDFVMISDSGIKMYEDTLMDMMAAMKPEVGLVQQVPYVGDRLGFASIYEKVYFGTQQSRSCLSANSVGLNCTTGMSCVIRKEVLDAAGGLSAFGKYLAEDYFIGEALIKRHFKTVICGQPAIQNSGQYSIKDFHNRMIRWAYLRSRMIPVFILLEPLSECMLLGVLASWAAYFVFKVNFIIFFFCHLTAWFTFDYLLLRTLENGPLPFSVLTFTAAWLLRESISLYLTFKAYSQSTITWRHKRYRVRWGGVAEEV